MNPLPPRQLDSCPDAIFALACGMQLSHPTRSRQVPVRERRRDLFPQSENTRQQGRKYSMINWSLNLPNNSLLR